MFGRKNSHDRDDYDLRSMLKSITELDRRNIDLELQLKKLETHINSLRGLINRKLYVKTEIDIDKPETYESETSISPDGLDSLRK